jgi:group I intron endonuclease
MSMNELPTTSGIYLITCTANGKIYVGSSIDIGRRWKKHRYTLKNACHHNQHLQAAWNKYGESSFEVSVIEQCNEDILVDREQYYLDTLKPFGDIGFNISIIAYGGLAGIPLTDEHKAKISAASKGRSPEHIAAIVASNKSRIITDEQRKRVSERSKGREPSIETRAKISLANKGRVRSPEWKAKMGASHKGKIISQEQRDKQSSAMKKAYIVTSPNGDRFRITGLKLFCDAQGIDHSSMSKVALGKYSQHKGWKCEYASE